jgi:hypothetical protein
MAALRARLGVLARLCPLKKIGKLQNRIADHQTAAAFPLEHIEIEGVHFFLVVVSILFFDGQKKWNAFTKRPKRSSTRLVLRIVG